MTARLVMVVRLCGRLAYHSAACFVLAVGASYWYWCARFWWWMAGGTPAGWRKELERRGLD